MGSLLDSRNIDPPTGDILQGFASALCETVRDLQRALGKVSVSEKAKPDAECPLTTQSGRSNLTR